MFAADGQKQDMLEKYKALADKSIEGNKGRNLYHLAAEFADYEAINLLCESGVKIRTDDYDNTPLHALTHTPYGNDRENWDKHYDAIYKTAAKLLELGVNPKRKNESNEIAYFYAGTNCMHPFIAAMADGGVKMDATGKENKNILHTICNKIYHRKSVKGEIETAVKTVRVLLEKGGIDPEDKDIFGKPPLHYAQQNGVKELVAVFTGAEDENEMKTGGMTVVQAVLNRDTEAVDALIASGADINEISDEHGKNALMFACEYPNLDMVKRLIKGGADVNFKNGANGTTAAAYLIASGVYNLRPNTSQPKELIKILRELIDGGLNVDDAITSDGCTALNLLCRQSTNMANQRYGLAEELINSGCDVNLADNNGVTPFMSFAHTGNEMNENIAELLLDSGGDTTLIDSASNTALIHAAYNLNKISAKKIAELILEKDPSTLNNTNNDGKTAMDAAIFRENEALVKILI